MALFGQAFPHLWIAAFIQFPMLLTCALLMMIAVRQRPRFISVNACYCCFARFLVETADFVNFHQNLYLYQPCPFITCNLTRAHNFESRLASRRHFAGLSIFYGLASTINYTTC